MTDWTCDQTKSHSNPLNAKLLQKSTTWTFKGEEVPLSSVSPRVYPLRPPLLMKVILNNLAASSLSPIVQYTMNTLPRKIMLAQQADLHRGTPQAWINTTDFYETKAKTLPSPEPQCQGHVLMTLPCMAKAQRHWINPLHQTVTNSGLPQIHFHPSPFRQFTFSNMQILFSQIAHHL